MEELSSWATCRDLPLSVWGTIQINKALAISTFKHKAQQLGLWMTGMANMCDGSSPFRTYRLLTPESGPVSSVFFQSLHQGLFYLTANSITDAADSVTQLREMQMLWSSPLLMLSVLWRRYSSLTEELLVRSQKVCELHLTSWWYLLYCLQMSCLLYSFQTEWQWDITNITQVWEQASAGRCSSGKSNFEQIVRILRSIKSKAARVYHRICQHVNHA